MSPTGGLADTGHGPGDPSQLAVRQDARRAPNRAIIAVLVAIGVLGLAGGATGLTLELTRHATGTEARAAARAEVATRWERLPAGQVFPGLLSYTDAGGTIQHVTRAGIAPPAPCRQAVDPPVAAALVRAGCVTVLRATYLDRTGVLAATVGVVVMRGTAAASRGYAGFGALEDDGLRAVTVPGTAARQFGDGQRQLFAAVIQGQGPYLFLATGGFTDGRPRTAGTAEPALSDLVNGLPAALGHALTRTGDPCHLRDVRC